MQSVRSLSICVDGRHSVLVVAVGIGGVEQCIQAVGWDQYIEAGNIVRIEEPAMGRLRILSVDRFNKEDARDEKEQGNRRCTPIVMMSSIQKTARRMCVCRHFYRSVTVPSALVNLGNSLPEVRSKMLGTGSGDSKYDRKNECSCSLRLRR